MISFPRRFHAPGRRDRLKAKIKQILEHKLSSKKIPLCGKSQKCTSSKAGPTSDVFSNRLAVDIFDKLEFEEVEPLCEKQALQISIDNLTLCLPPSYKECVPYGPVDIIEKKESDIYPQTNELKSSIIADFDLKTESSPVKLTELTANAHLTARVTKAVETTVLPKDSDRGRKHDILYRSQLNEPSSQRFLRRPSPREPRDPRLLPQTIICFAMVQQMNRKVTLWHEMFRIFRIAVLMTILMIFAKYALLQC